MIDSPYVLSDISISGNTLTVTNGDLSTKTITLPSYDVATNAKAGLWKPTLYYNGSVKFNSGSVSSGQGAVVNEATTVTGRYYAVASDAKGQPFVNVPWDDTTVSSVTVADSGNNVNISVASSDKVTKTATVCSKLTEQEILAILN